MNVVVAMAWRSQPERIASHDHVIAWHRQHLPDAALIEVDTGHAPYNLAAVRNECVRRAEAAGAEVVVITDADAIVADPAQLHGAITRAATSGRLHLPFQAQRYLTAAETADVIAGGQAPLDGSHGNGAIYAVAPGTYWRFGGSDERFSGWGGDDDQLVAAAMCLAGLRRHPGTVWSLWHADERRPIGTEEHRPNAELAARYWQARDSRDAMRRLIAER